jgi:hypothetical protein
MTLDVRGSLKNTKLSTDKFVVFEELFSNAIDAYLIRKNGDPSVDGLKVEFLVEFWSTDLFDNGIDLSISCKDNGCGFGDLQSKAFLTKDTSYKDDLSISGIGKCKGAGRIQYFHHFSDMTIDSTYLGDSGMSRRGLAFKELQKDIDDDRFIIVPAAKKSDIETVIKLSKLKQNIRERIFDQDNLTELFSVKNLRNQILVLFLQRLVGLASQLGKFEVAFKSKSDKPAAQDEIEYLRPSDLPPVNVSRLVKAYETDLRTGIVLDTFQELQLSHYILKTTDYDIPKNSISLCAKSSPVKDITNRYLRTKTLENKPILEAHHIVLIEGDVFDRGVNDQRDGFDRIPDEIKGGDLYNQEKISFQQVFEAIDDVIGEWVTPPDWNKETIVKHVTERFGVSEAMLAETETRVRYGDTADTVAERVLKKYQDRIIKGTAEIFELKEEIAKCDPASDEFREKVNQIAWKYSSSIKDVDKANLSQLIVRRSAIVEILRLACQRQLDIQIASTVKRRTDEALIHSIFFPMRKDSSEKIDHDIWLLNEEYHYYDYIASDMPLAKIKLSDDGELFSPDIDDELSKLFKKNFDENAKKRPDIAIFTKEGSAIIIEFKAPDVSMDDHVPDLMEYAQLLAAKSGGRLKRFYGYLIGNTLNPNRLRAYTRFPTGKGYFGTDSVIDHTTGRLIGELYSEILFYDDLVDRADKRLEVYKEKLNIDFR